MIALVLAVLFAVAGDSEPVVHVEAKRFVFAPDTIEMKVGQPVVLELVAIDRTHGFSIPDLGVRTDVPVGQPVRIRLIPQKAGRFEFHCDVFCGSGHEEMSGVLVVKP
jgi:cytochrome c oxidase subunit II